MFIEYKRQISCEIKMKSLLQSLCIPLFQEVQATSRCSITQWCSSHMSESSNGCVMWAYQVTFPLFAYFVLVAIPVAIPHKQVQYHCSDIPTSFLCNNKGFLLSFGEIINLLKQPKVSVMEVGFKYFGFQYKLKEFNKKATIYFTFHGGLLSVCKQYLPL